MQIVIDIPADDFNSIRYGGLYAIGHDRLDESVTKAFQSGTILSEGHGDLIDLNTLKGELFWVSDCPHIKLNEQALEIWRTIEKAPIVVKGESDENSN